MSLPTRNHHIALAEAARMTRRFRETHPAAEKGGAFHANQVRELLGQRGCTALRYYHALDAAEQQAIVLVGVDTNGADLTDGVLMELHFPCPPYCGGWSELNSSASAVAANLSRRLRAEPSLVLPPRDHRITLTEAARMTARWRERFPEAEKGGAFLADQVQELVEQRDVAALRYYYALDELNEPAMVLVGVDAEGADLTAGVLLELHFPCPPYCGDLNPLNSSRSAYVTAEESWRGVAFAARR
jgi:hypothetical protein